MARDAQLAGDRVQTEYYLQFADHYFRVLSESRARFEDQHQQSRRPRDEDMDEEEGEELVDAADAEPAESEERQERHDRGPRRPRDDREPRRFSRDERGANDEEDRSEARPHLNGGGDSLPLDVLPPAIGADDIGEGASQEA